MRSTTLGTAVLSTAIIFAFVSILFSNISFTILSVAFASAYVYAYRRFASELARTNLKIDRKIPDEMSFATEPVSITVEVLNRNPVAVRGTFEDLIPEDCDLSHGVNKTTMVLPPRSVLKLNFSIIPRKRGPHLMPGMRIDREDVLGLFEEVQIIEHPDTVNVHTQKGSFDTARKMAGREHLEFPGVGRNPAIVLREFEFDGIRDYVPGDKARDIHWKMLPKTGKLMTKIYRKEGSVHTTIFIDCSRSMRLETYKLAKIDQALDLSMQLSNVLISSFHPVGVGIFDEMKIIDKISPALGRHQFDKIVKLLRDVPSAVKSSGLSPARSNHSAASEKGQSIGKIEKVSDEGRAFLTTLEKLSASGARKKLGIGLEGGIKEIIAKSRGQEQLFIVISDMISCRNAVIAGAKLCGASGHRMLVLHMFDDWYRNPGNALEINRLEELYGDLSVSIKAEAALRGFGAQYMRIGPADTTSRIVRAIRRGKA